MDLDEIMKKNIEKANKKREKQGLPPQKITNTAKLNTRAIAKTCKAGADAGGKGSEDPECDGVL